MKFSCHFTFSSVSIANLSSQTKAGLLTISAQPVERTLWNRLVFVANNAHRAENVYEQGQLANVAPKAILTEHTESSIASTDQVWRSPPEPNCTVNICGHVAQLGAAELRRAWCAVNLRQSLSCQPVLMNLTLFVSFQDKLTRIKGQKIKERVEKKKKCNLA